MIHIAWVTCEQYSDIHPNEKEAVDYLSEFFQITPVVWSIKTDWNLFDAIVIRTTWDYYKYPEKYLEWLSGLPPHKVFNRISTVTWNLNKRYLIELGSLGIPIVPTQYVEKNKNLDSISLAIQSLGVDRLVLKPALSAGAYKTQIIHKTDTINSMQYKNRDVLIQPYFNSITLNGEVSLVYFLGNFSHSVLKRPKAGDFRVQTEFGGTITPHDASSAEINLGKLVHQKLLALGFEMPLYSRVDILKDDQKYYLMELELIEPELFFLKNKNAFENFKQALFIALS